MKRIQILIYVMLGTTCCCAQHNDYTGGLCVVFDQPTDFSGRQAWYKGNEKQWDGETNPDSAGDTVNNPDPDWENRSLPIGNGSLGANILGSIETERITFNEKSLWRGGPDTAQGAQAYWNVNKQSAGILKEIREAFLKNDQALADSLTCNHFNSTVPYESYAENPFRFGNFTTMGEFYIHTGIKPDVVSRYERILSLDSALAVVRFSTDKVQYQRKYFISCPDNVMVIRFSADRQRMQNIDFSYAPSPVAIGNINAEGSNGLVYKARLTNNNMQFVIRIRAINQGGTISNEGGRLCIRDANEVLFIVTADTDYKLNLNPDFTDSKAYVGGNPDATTQATIQQVEQKTFTQLLQRHTDDYIPLFSRVQLKLNNTTFNTGISTPERLKRYREGIFDNYLETLYFQFGRYLLLSSSREGNLPANLQGIWHNNVDGPWRVDYHNNINLQMNYWPACSTNLSECTLPLIEYIASLVKPGRVTAKSYFGARGWTASISSNIFGFTSPLSSTNMSWNFNPMAGPWLATHLWEYYDFTRDKQFLSETGYPILKESARFVTDYLWYRPDGIYTAAPSTSPEHGPIDEGTTFVHAVIREILSDAIDASRILCVDVQERKEWQRVLGHLAPYRIGRYGQLMEWSKDIDDPQDQHRHVNHLFGLHPGHTISPLSTPKLAKACEIVLQHRGDFATGWSMGWKLNQWARLHNGNHSYTLFQNLLKNSTMDNLWDTHPPFQIDGNFGGTAGIAEMLLQSHMGYIHVLPALPDAWEEGSVSGLCARGNFLVGIDWEKHQLKRITIESRSGAPCSVYYDGVKMNFSTQTGRCYILEYKQGKLVMLR